MNSVRERVLREIVTRLASAIAPTPVLRMPAVPVTREASPALLLFVDGDSITLPDLCLVPQIYNARRVGIDIAAYPNIARINAAIAIDVPHISRIGGGIQIPKGDQTIKIYIGQAGAQTCRDFTLIEPNIQIKFRVRVIYASINYANHIGHRPDVALRPGIGRLAAKWIGRAGVVAIHAPKVAIDEKCIIRRAGDRNCRIFDNR